MNKLFTVLNRFKSVDEIMDPSGLSVLPYELLVHILSFVDFKTQVFACRRVCKLWCEIVENESLRERAIMTGKVSRSSSKFSWYVYYALGQDVFNKNLLMNTDGRKGFSHWTITANGGDKWKVESPFAGCSPLPAAALLENAISEFETVGCFATSYGRCEKSQMIKLNLLTSKLMDLLKPTIVASEWYAPRFDCGSVYTLTVELLDTNHKILQTCSFSDRMEAWTEASWKRAEVVLNKKDVGVKFIRFKHFGQDTQFWAGHYGSKMTLARVCLQLPKPETESGPVFEP